MPTETTTDAPEAAPVEPTEQTPEAATADEPLGDGGKKALDAERNARKAAEKRLAEFEAAEKARRESEMTALEKAKAEADELRAKAAAAEASALKSRIASETGVPESLLSGDDEEAMRASADALLQFRGSAPTVPSSDGQGAVGTPVGNSVKQLTEADLTSMTDAEINQARRDGRLDTLLRVARKD